MCTKMLAKYVNKNINKISKQKYKQNASKICKQNVLKMYAKYVINI